MHLGSVNKGESMSLTSSKKNILVLGIIFVACLGFFQNCGQPIVIDDTIQSNPTDSAVLPDPQSQGYTASSLSPGNAAPVPTTTPMPSVGTTAAASPGFYAAVEMVYENANVANALSTQPTVVLRRRITGKAGDIVVVRALKQFTEDDSRRTRVLAWVEIDGALSGTRANQSVSRGSGNNHHMPMTVFGHRKLTQDGAVNVELRGQKSVATSVTVDVYRYGGMIVEVYRRFNSIADAKLARARFLQTFQDDAFQGSSNPQLLGKNNGYKMYQLKSHTYAAKAGDFIQMNYQSFDRFNSTGKPAEMVAMRLTVEDPSGKELVRSAVGENLNAPIPYQSKNVLLGHQVANDVSTRLRVYQYGGNGTGFFHHGSNAYMQSLVFTEHQNASMGLVDIQKIPLSSDRSVRDFKKNAGNLEQIEGSQFAAIAGDLIRISSSSQMTMTSSKASVCELLTVVMQKSGADWTVIKRSPAARRSLSAPYDKTATLVQFFSHRISSQGDYKAGTETRCFNSSNDFVGKIESSPAAISIEHFSLAK